MRKADTAQIYAQTYPVKNEPRMRVISGFGNIEAGARAMVSTHASTHLQR